MIDIAQQEAFFIAIGNILTKKLTVYAIGGTAMMLRSIKDSTLDIDFVFKKRIDREVFIEVLKKLGSKDSDVTLVYGLKNNTPIMRELGGARFDLFLNKVITSTFSENMEKRAEQTHEFGKNLIVKVASPQDIILMKSATSRTKDLNDIVSISQKTPINWKSLIEDAQEQVSLGNEVAILSLGENLEKLKQQKLISVPKEVLDNLYTLLKKQIDEKKKI